MRVQEVGECKYSVVFYDENNNGSDIERKGAASDKGYWEKT